MSISRKLLCTVYALIAVLTLIGTWGNNLQLMDGEIGFLGANLLFWEQTLVNPASRSITVDILGIAMAAVIWMFLEARRLSMRGIWLYLFASIFIAVGAAFPLFLLHRERALARIDGNERGGALSPPALLALTVVILGLPLYLYFALRV